MNKILKYITITLAVMAGCLGMGSCIEDGVSSSASDQPEFSTDTVRMGDLFTLDASPTHRFTVYNRHDKGINISRVSLADDPERNFRINVDGMAGRDFNNVEIRANDSIFVFVEVTLPENGRNLPVDMLAHIEFQTNGVSKRVPVSATGRDVVRLNGDTRYSGDVTLSADKPYLVGDSLVVEEGATLRIPAGVELYFRDDAQIAVHGTLLVEGDAEHPVVMTGNRTGFVASDIPYELMSGQWRGIEFHPTSKGNLISHASIRNSANGLILNRLSEKNPEGTALTLVNSQIRNTKWYVVEAVHSNVVAAGCELTDASMGIVRLVGGRHEFTNCTFANYYLFTALGGPAVQLEHVDSENTDEESEGLPYLAAEFRNSIIYGNGTELNHESLEGMDVYLRRCLLRSAGSDDDNFINCLWDEDPMYHTDRNAYLFDYRLKAESPALGAGYAELLSPLSLTDMLGIPRRATAPALGAYEGE